MHFDVRFIDINIENFSEFIEYSSKELEDIVSIKSHSEFDKSRSVDLYIVNLNHPSLQTIIDEKKYTIFLYENEDDLKKLPINKENDTLKIPFDFERLFFKIKYYIQMLKKDLLLKHEQELSNSIINGINNPIFLTDGVKVLFANNYFLELSDSISIQEINVKYPRIGEIFQNESEYLNDLDKNWLNNIDKNNKVCILNKNNQKAYFSLQRIHLSHNDTNIIILTDISHEINHKEELYNLLYTDSLTKLPNRAKLIEELQNGAINIDSVAILDINSFKEINDFFGHKVGDRIIYETGKLIKFLIDDYKNLKLYKFPSDTYCITNTNDEKDRFINLIKSIVDIIFKKVFIVEQHEIDVKITAGISYSNKNNKLITADIALQSAKKDNKDYLVFYDELDKFQEYENNMIWTKKLKNAFVNDQIEVYYQPLINNTTLKVEKYECLVRLIDDDGKVISPYFFLDISKKSNQYTKITKIVIEKSFKKFEKLPFEFSVNISYEDIEEEGFLNFMKTMLKKHNVNNKVVFEILENENIKNYTLLINFIDEIKALGCKVAIDDFGSGYSNFEHLLKMHVDYLKIDASLIKNVAKDENSYKITKTIIDFAKSLNLKTIAEFVENEDIFKIVKNLGADYSQGYYFSAPTNEPKEVIIKG